MAKVRWRPSTTHTKQGPGKAEDEWTLDWERSTARDESGARSQRLGGLIPDQNMFAQDGTRNLKHGGCGGSKFRCGQVAEMKHQTGQLIIGKAGTTSAMLVMRAVENWTPERSARPRRTTTS